MDLRLLILTNILFNPYLLVFAQIKRISEVELDLEKPKLIYIAPGRSTVIDFPCDIDHSILGLHDDIEVKIGPSQLDSLVIWLTSSVSQPTNLPVRCKKTKELIVLDIYPNKLNHQDYLKITSLYKSSSRKNRKLINSSKNQFSSEIRFNKKKLISRSKK